MALAKITSISGRAVHVPGNDIDTDRIIPARFMKCVTFDGLGEYLFYDVRKHADGTDRPHPLNEPRFRGATILLSGANFGCGSSREHAPIALGAAGAQAVIAESYARIFFRNCVATGELYPIESAVRLCDTLKTGQIGRLDLDAGTLVVEGVIHRLKPLGEARPVIDAGGLFKYARRNHLIPVR